MNKKQRTEAMKILEHSGCFRCGYVDTDESTDVSESGIARCPECGEKSLMTLGTALDLLNEIYLKTENGSIHFDESAFEDEINELEDDVIVELDFRED